MGHGFEASTPTVEAERKRIDDYIAVCLSDHYVPWEGPGLEVERLDGSWTFLRASMADGKVVVAGFKAEHTFDLP